MPILHFNRTSHEINKIHHIPCEDIETLVRHDLIDANLRKPVLNPAPIVRGMAQRSDVFF